MKKLIVKFKDVDELLTHMDILVRQIKQGNLSGTLMDGWDISEVYDDERD